MITRFWPIAVIVISNVIYHICAKEVPSDMDGFASLTIAYAVACAMSYLCYIIFKKRPAAEGEVAGGGFKNANWTPFALGVIIVGLEFGWIMAYKAGWPVSMGYIIVTSVVCSVLLFVGYLLYKEKITRNKVIGIVLCLAGLILINL